MYFKLFQIPHLPDYGRHLSKICLTQCDFLHPQSLNPFAKHCPNLETIAIYGCGDVSDEMFVGGLPELEERPFKRLKTLIFEGKLARHVGR